MYNLDTIKANDFNIGKFNWNYKDLINHIQKIEYTVEEQMFFYEISNIGYIIDTNYKIPEKRFMFIFKRIKLSNKLNNFYNGLRLTVLNIKY
jgi:hypothetical protein